MRPRSQAEKDAEFERRFLARFAAGDYHAIFTRGCCYHFALKAHEIHGYPIIYLPSDSADQPIDATAVPAVTGDVAEVAPAIVAVGHCWVRMPSGASVDINGVMPEQWMLKLYWPGRTQGPQEISPERLRESLSARKYPEALNPRIFDLAEQILMTHERFGDAKSQEKIRQSLFGDV
jgi:hypothetical protein